MKTRVGDIDNINFPVFKQSENSKRKEISVEVYKSILVVKSVRTLKDKVKYTRLV